MISESVIPSLIGNAEGTTLVKGTKAHELCLRTPDLPGMLTNPESHHDARYNAQLLKDQKSTANLWWRDLRDIQRRHHRKRADSNSADEASHLTPFGSASRSQASIIAFVYGQQSRIKTRTHCVLQKRSILPKRTDLPRQYSAQTFAYRQHRIIH